MCTELSWIEINVKNISFVCQPISSQYSLSTSPENKEY